MGTPAITLSPGGGFLLETTGSTIVFTPEMSSDEQRMMKETADDFMAREVAPRVADIEAKKPGSWGRSRRTAGWAARSRRARGLRGLGGERPAQA